MAKKWPEKVVQRSFIKGHWFRNSLYFERIWRPKYQRYQYVFLYGISYEPYLIFRKWLSKSTIVYVDSRFHASGYARGGYFNDVTLAAQCSAAHGPVTLLFSVKVIFSTKALENWVFRKWKHIKIQYNCKYKNIF